MKVIILKDIPNLGKKHEVKNVKEGYAMNFLIPRGLVKAADKKSMDKLEQLKKKEVLQAEQELKETQELASKIDGQEIEFKVKIGEEDQLFESVTKDKISKKLQELGFGIKKEQIILDKPIKQLGEFPIKIELDHQLEANIVLIVESLQQE